MARCNCLTTPQPCSGVPACWPRLAVLGLLALALFATCYLGPLMPSPIPAHPPPSSTHHAARGALPVDEHQSEHPPENSPRPKTPTWTPPPPSHPIFWESNIGVGSYPFGVTFNSVNGYIYVSNFGSNNVSVIDPNEGRVIAWIPLAFGVARMVADPISGDVYVGDANSDVFVISGATNRVTDVIHLSANPFSGFSPDPNTYDPMTQEVYAVDWGTANLTAIRGTTVTANVTLYGDTSSGAVYDSRAGTVFATSYNSSYNGATGTNVSLVNASSHTSVVTNATVHAPSQLAYDPQTREVFFAGYDGNVSVVDDRTDSVVATIPVFYGGTGGIVYDARNGDLYATERGYSNRPGNSVAILNASSLRVVGTLPVQTEPIGIAYDDKTNELFVADAQKNNVTIINLTARYNVNFAETGLPVGTNWSVTLNGEVRWSTGPDVNFTEPNATYSFAIMSEPGYRAAPISGALTVLGTDVNTPVSWARVLYTTSFVQVGLPTGTSWSVTLGGQTIRSMGAQVIFSEPNGSFPFTLGLVPGFTPTPDSGIMQVTGDNVSLSVTFVQVLYSITVDETGLPVATNWSVVLDGQARWSTQSSIHFLDPNGTYSFTLGLVPGFVPSQHGGSVLVTGADVDVTADFVVALYSVAIRESGLPPGTNWSIVVGGGRFWSTQPSMALKEPNGTYPISAPTAHGFSAEPSSGTITVDGSSVSLSVVFHPIPPPGLNDTYLLAADLSLGLLLAVLVVSYVGQRRRPKTSRSTRLSEDSTTASVPDAETPTYGTADEDNTPVGT